MELRAYRDKQGKEHAFKNGAAGGCHDGSCTIRKLGSDSGAGGEGKELPLPDSVHPEASELAGQCGYVIYGAEWCIFCRRATHLLAALGISEFHVDVDEHGGSTACVSALSTATGVALKGLPVIFEAGSVKGPTATPARLLQGGFRELEAELKRRVEGGEMGVGAEVVAEAMGRAEEASRSSVVMAKVPPCKIRHLTPGLLL